MNEIELVSDARVGELANRAGRVQEFDKNTLILDAPGWSPFDCCIGWVPRDWLPFYRSSDPLTIARSDINRLVSSQSRAKTLCPRNSRPQEEYADCLQC